MPMNQRAIFGPFLHRRLRREKDYTEPGLSVDRLYNMGAGRKADESMRAKTTMAGAPFPAIVVDRDDNSPWMSNCSGWRVASLLTRMFLLTSSSNSDQPRGVVGFEDLHGFGVDAEKHIGAFKMFFHFAQLDVDLVADGNRALDHAGGLASGAGNAQGALEGLLDALAGDGDESKIVKLQHLGGSAVGLESFFERGKDLEAVLALVHVNEVDDDDAAEIAEANLADDSGTASRLVLTMVSSRRADLPTYLPVLMSMATSASV